MNAAVVRSKYKKTELDKAVKDYKETVLPAIAKHEGARSAMLLLNRETGDALSIAMYENEAAAQSFAPTAAKLIESKATVEKGDRAFNAHDVEEMARQTAPDGELTASGDIKVKGPQAIK